MNSIFPIGVATAIEPRQIVLATCAGRQLAVWCDSQGRLHATQGWCPHCGSPLHSGRVQDDRIQCAHHGWSYDSEGECQSSALRDVLPTSSVPNIRTFEVTRHHDLLWLSVEAARGGLENWLSNIAFSGALAGTAVRSIFVRADLGAVRRALATVQLPPHGYHDGATDLIGSDAEVAVWRAGGRLMQAVHMRNVFSLRVGSVILRGQQLPLQGLLYGLQETGTGLVGIHVSALWEGHAPASYRRLLSRVLRRTVRALMHTKEPPRPRAAHSEEAA